MFHSSKTSLMNARITKRGFTLVEMLVAVTLVLLMMTMFAQFFQMATNAMSQQRGISENDQRERLLQNVFRGDLDKRTFRDVFPFRSNEDTREIPRSLPRRMGYFEIDEGDPLNDTDDVLQFTALVHNVLKNKDVTPFTGKARNLSPVAVAITGVTSTGNTSTITVASALNFTVPTAVWISGSTGNDGRYIAVPNGNSTTVILDTSTYVMLNNPTPLQLGTLYVETNEAEIDDGVYGNNSGTSGAAEICYFLRNGILYRRVLLIRDSAIGTDSQPTLANGNPLLYSNATKAENYPYGVPSNAPTTSFWRDFDYSAFYFNGKNGAVSPGVRFHHSSDSLSNSIDAQQVLLSNSVSFPFSLGIPTLRYGHGSPYGAVPGMPQGTYSVVSRFTLQECANLNFGYPGYMPAAGCPLDRMDLTINPATGAVSQYEIDPLVSPPPRRGEDILMSNVLTFDVKVWDSMNNTFVDIGDATFFPNGPFGSNPPTIQKAGKTIAGRLNVAYGNSFDTWHPLAGTGTGEPPYMPFAVGANGQLLPAVLTAVQITINFRDTSSGSIRQTTIVHSLLDKIKPPPQTIEPPEE